MFSYYYCVVFFNVLHKNKIISYILKELVLFFKIFNYKKNG
ncbi:hypothetical protein RCH33_1460 [Flavobacterium daejeonense]|nr:hypothetical protein RCH33_1460 [Flavobacterium daejeonense]